MPSITQEKSISAMTGLEHLSPKLQDILRRITRTKVFKLKGVGDILTNAKELDTDAPVHRKYSGSYEANTYISDPFDENSPKKQVVAMKKVVSSADAKGNVIKEEQYGYVEFMDSGYIFVEPSEKSLLAFLLFNDNCGTWKYRDVKRPIFWVEEKVSDKENVLAKTGDILLKGKVIDIVSKMNFDLMRQYLSKIAISYPEYNPLNKTGAAVKYDLLHYVDKSPRDFIEISIDEKLKTELKVKDAVSINILIYDFATREWKFKDEPMAIMTISIGTNADPEEELVKFLGEQKHKPVLSKLEDLLMGDEY